jgi:IS4 transposase
VAPTGFYAQRAYPKKLQYVEFFNREKQQRIRLLTNQFTSPAITVADLYRCHWQVESFFTWIKEHLRIKSFCDTSENGAKTQIWIAVSV